MDLTTLGLGDAPSMKFTWLACELKSGLIVGELPLTTDRVRRIMAREETANWSLPTADDACPDFWADITVPGFHMLVLCINDTPTQAWALTSRDIGLGGVALGGPTLEHCLARSNVLSLEGEEDEALLLAFILANAAINFGFAVDWERTGRTSYVDYSHEEDMSCLEALNRWLDVEGGPEWRIRLHRNGARILKTIEVKARIGQDRPHVVFDLDQDNNGNLSAYQRRTSYGPENGATAVIAVSDGSGAARPMTTELESSNIVAGWPKWEARPSFPNVDAASIDDEDAELLRLATETLRTRENGTTTWTFTGDDTAPRPGVEFSEGDTVHVRIAPQGKSDPIGGTAEIRVLGWEIQPTSGEVTVIGWEDPQPTPAQVLAEEEEEAPPWVSQ